MESGLFHCHVDNVSRRRKDGGERSVVATAAYVSGSDLWNEREQKISRFGGRKDVVHSELLAPEGAPGWARDRERLWNMVDGSARRRDARLAKTIVVAFSREIPKDNWVTILREFVQPYVAQGMVADAAIHDDGTGQNPHMHVLLTVSHLKPDGFGGKMTNVDQKSFVTQARTGWETVANKHLVTAGAGVRLDRRSYKARGISKIPTVHRGPNPKERRAQRARAADMRQEKAVTYKPTDQERSLYPLLTQRHDWPPSDSRMPSGLTASERDEFARFRAERETDARVAAQRDFDDHRVPDWFDTKQDEAALRPGLRAEQKAEAWYLKDERTDQAAVVGRGLEEAPRDGMSQTSSFGQDLNDRRTAYERDVFSRAVNMPASHEEQELLRLAEKTSPEMREQVGDELFARRLSRIRESDDARRLVELERQMGPELRDRFDAYVSREPDPDTYPVPGPYWEAEAPSKLERAQDAMVDQYERDDER